MLSVVCVQCWSVIAEASLPIVILHVIVTELRFLKHLLSRIVLRLEPATTIYTRRVYSCFQASHFPGKTFPRKTIRGTWHRKLLLVGIFGDIVLTLVYLNRVKFKAFVSSASNRLWSCSLLLRQYWVVNSSVLITKCDVASSVSLRWRWRG